MIDAQDQGEEQEPARDLERGNENAKEVELGPFYLDPGHALRYGHRPRASRPFSVTLVRGGVVVKRRRSVRFRDSR